ncbi:MAG: isochorismatase [Candidatus Binatia bacterium]|nr:MAG: isochorismatase [Candidatus Binatia bacterium]
MPFDLARALRPESTALLLFECQEGIVGREAAFPALREAVERRGLLDNLARLREAASQAHVPVFHLTTSRREDGAGSRANCPLLAASRKSPPLVPGSPRQAIVAPLAPREGEFVLARMHGVSPFHASELDALLRNLGVETVVVTGVSLNVGILGTTIEAVNCGYSVVVPRDCVAGTPEAYAEAVLENTIRLLAAVVDSTEIAEVWRRSGEREA